MRRCGEGQLADLGEPQGREAGFSRPVFRVTAQVVLDQIPSVVQVVRAVSADPKAPIAIPLRGSGMSPMRWRCVNWMASPLASIGAQEAASPSSNGGRACDGPPQLRSHLSRTGVPV